MREGGGGRIRMVNTTYLADMLDFTFSSYTLMWFPEFLIRLDILYNYFMIGEDDKAVFSIPGIIGTRSLKWTPSYILLITYVYGRSSVTLTFY
jgi:hypothetical protein